MTPRTFFRVLLLDGDRQQAAVSIRRIGSNVIRLRRVPFRTLRHLATFQGVRL